MSRPDRAPGNAEEERVAYPQHLMVPTGRGPMPWTVVRASCGATGVDIGKGLCLIVSAQDNNLFVDKINTAGIPAENPVLPSPDEVAGARALVASSSMHAGAHGG